MIDWTAVSLGVIEGITEFLPISSTGHLLIAEHWLGSRSDTFNIVIQAGAMLAVTIVYWQRLSALLLGWRQPENRLYLCKLAGAFFVSVGLGLIAKRVGIGLPATVAPVAWALVIGGFWMIVAEWVSARRQADRVQVSWIACIMVGIAQIVAGVFPGTSRSGATIFAAMLFGTSNRGAATEFAFLVGIPTMYAASAYQLYGTFSAQAHEDWGSLATGFVVSAVTAFAAIKWLLGYIRTHRFTSFAVYRIIVGAALLAVPI